jgi:hypothetical protein
LTPGRRNIVLSPAAREWNGSSASNPFELL